MKGGVRRFKGGARLTMTGQDVLTSMADDVYDDDDDEEATAYPANDVEPGHARLHLNQINRVKWRRRESQAKILRETMATIRTFTME